MVVNNIGERVKNFRLSRGLTQQWLELEIDASNGHISKVESGQLNPSKETLLKIAEVLKLTEKETIYLVGIKQDKVSDEEIKEAIRDTKDYLDSSRYPSFLQDDYLFVHNWNEKMLDLLDVSLLLANLFRGRNMLEMLLQPQFKKTMKKERWEELFANDLVFFMRHVDYELSKNTKVLKDLIEYLIKHYSEFEGFWQKALKIYPEITILGDNLIYFNKGSQEICYYMSVINLVRHPRFRIVEYIPVS